MKTVMTIVTFIILIAMIYFTNLALTESSKYWLFAGIGLFGLLGGVLAIGKAEYKEKL